MTSDLEIAVLPKWSPLKRGVEVGISSHELMPMGNGVAKSPGTPSRNASQSRREARLVTSVNPTRSAKENRHHHRTHTGAEPNWTIGHLRHQRTLHGPVFGIKGGAAGGGHAQVCQWRTSTST